MKKFFALVLACAVVLSLGVTAFAASPTGSSSSSTVDLGWGDFTVAAAPAKAAGVPAYDKDNKEVVEVPADSIVLVPVGEADKLDEADKEAFLAAYEEAKAVEGKVVKYFYWLGMPKELEGVDFEWFRYDFKCAGENVEATVNGHPMEVVHVDGVDYHAKLTEFGAIAILCD